MLEVRWSPSNNKPWPTALPFSLIMLRGIFVPLFMATLSAILSAVIVGLNRKLRLISFYSSRGRRFIIYSEVSLVNVRRLGELSRILLRSKASWILSFYVDVNLNPFGVMYLTLFLAAFPT